MTNLVILYWRDIPAQVIAGHGRRAAKRELSVRFTEAIDMAAMRSGAASSDAYLADWRKGDPITVDGDPEQAVTALAEKIEAEYDKARLVALVKNDGRET